MGNTANNQRLKEHLDAEITSTLLQIDKLARDIDTLKEEVIQSPDNPHSHPSSIDASELTGSIIDNYKQNLEEMKVKLEEAKENQSVADREYKKVKQESRHSQKVINFAKFILNRDSMSNEEKTLMMKLDRIESEIENCTDQINEKNLSKAKIEVDSNNLDNLIDEIQKEIDAITEPDTSEAENIDHITQLINNKQEEVNNLNIQIQELINDQEDRDKQIDAIEEEYNEEYNQKVKEFEELNVEHSQLLQQLEVNSGIITP